MGANPSVRLEFNGKEDLFPARPLNLVLGSLGLTQQAAKFGVERYTGTGWERFPTHRTPQPGDRLRVGSPPEKDQPYLRRLMGKLMNLRKG